MNVHITLYHVTPSANLDSISDRGISPEFSQGKRKIIWLCDDTEVVWAIAHIANKRQVLTAALTVCVVSVPELALRRTKWRGVYQLDIPSTPTRYHSIKRALLWHEQVMRADVVHHILPIDDIPF